MAESQETPQVEQAPVSEPQNNETPKMTPDQFSAALARGEIDVSSNDPESVIAKYVDLGNEGGTPEAEPVPEEGGTPPRQQEEEGPPDTTVPKETQKVDIPRFKTIGELLDFARKETGDSFSTAYDFIRHSKNRKEHLGRLQKAVDEWKRDALSHQSVAQAVREEMEQIKSERDALTTKLKEFEELRQRQTQPQQKPSADEIDEPEVQKPDELADADEWRSYYQKVAERNERIKDKKHQAEIEALRRDIEAAKVESSQKAQQTLDELKRAEEQRVAREAQNRRFEESVMAASDFQAKHPEFRFEDGADVRAKNEEYGKWAQTLAYIADQNPAFKGRDLAGEYLAGSQDVQDLVDRYGATPPADAKKFRLMIELENLAWQHSLIVGAQYDRQGRLIAGRPNFDLALAMKKNMDGVDIDELQQARTRGADEVLNVIQDRQSAPPEIGAHEQTVVGKQKSTTAQLQDALGDLQRRMSTMRPEDVDREMATLEARFREAGVPIMLQQR